MEQEHSMKIEENKSNILEKHKSINQNEDEHTSANDSFYESCDLSTHLIEEDNIQIRQG